MTDIKPAMSTKLLEELIKQKGLSEAARALGTYKQRLDALMRRDNKNIKEFMQLTERARRILKRSKSAAYDELIKDAEK